MQRIVLALLFLICSSGCFSSGGFDTVDFHYSGLTLRIPANACVIASNGGDDNVLIFRYGPEKGKKFLAFSDLTHDSSLSYGCEPAVFFDDVFNENGQSNCNREQLNVFSEVFLTDVEKGSWVGSEMTVYFTIGKEHSFLFACDANKKVIKIDTDFLNKSELKGIVEKYLK